MTTVVLLRHGRSTANVAGVLAGRSEGVTLDDKGLGQAEAVAGRLSGIRFDRLISSPLQRCRQTMGPVAAATGLPLELDDAFAEVDYGQWTGRKLGELSGEPLWRVVQEHPSGAVFPGGEGLAGVSARAIAGVREIVRSGPESVILLCSHGDVIKAILADALGLHLDGFQRIMVSPASLSVIRYTATRPFVERVNDSGELGTLRPPPVEPQADDAAPADESDAVPGGSAG